MPLPMWLVLLLMSGSPKRYAAGMARDDRWFPPPLFSISRELRPPLVLLSKRSSSKREMLRSKKSALCSRSLLIRLLVLLVLEGSRALWLWLRLVPVLLLRFLLGLAAACSEPLRREEELPDDVKRALWLIMLARCPFSFLAIMVLPVMDFLLVLEVTPLLVLGLIVPLQGDSRPQGESLPPPLLLELEPDRVLVGVINPPGTINRRGLGEAVAALLRSLLFLLRPLAGDTSFLGRKLLLLSLAPLRLILLLLLLLVSVSSAGWELLLLPLSSSDWGLFLMEDLLLLETDFVFFFLLSSSGGPILSSAGGTTLRECLDLLLLRALELRRLLASFLTCLVVELTVSVAVKVVSSCQISLVAVAVVVAGNA